LDEARIIVPTERHVERLGLEGLRAETRSALGRRLIAALAPEARFATPEVTRLALTEALRAALWDDDLLGPLVRASGSPYLRTVELVDEAIGELRRAVTPLAALEAVEKGGGSAGLRASTLRRAMVALDRTLEVKGMIDARSQGRVLADVLRRTRPDEVVAAVRAKTLTARFIVAWDPVDLTWWSALARAFARVTGQHVRIELPSFGRNDLDPMRERDPLEALFDEVAPVLDDPPLFFTIPPILGDFAAASRPSEPDRVEVVAAADAMRQARAAVHAARKAIAEGVPVDRIAVALPRIDEEVLVPLRAAFVEAGLPFHEPRGAPAASAAIVAAALDAHTLAARGLPRLDVAMLLRSRYVDAPKVTGIDERREAKRVLLQIADALEGAPSKVGVDAARAFEETIASAGGEPLRPVARRIADLLTAVELANTRSAHARAARSLWDALGFPARVSLDARATLATDDVPVGLARAELGALSRDAHGWRVLIDSVEAYMAAVSALGLGAAPVSSEVFRYELSRTLEAGAPPPGAGRVGALRIVRVGEIAGEPLAHLIVLDANEGILPPSAPAGPLLPDALAERLRAIDPGAAPASAGMLRARELSALALAASAAERVTLFYRECGDGGEALAPSPFVLALTRGGARARRSGGGALVDAPLSHREAELQRASRLGIGAPGVEPEATRRAKTERTREVHHGLATPRPRNDLVGDLAVDAALAGVLEAESGGGDRPLPITSLERFARCAFQGYVHQLLGVRDVRTVGETPDAREAGTLVHEALAAAMRAALPLLQVRPMDRDAVRTLAMEAADAVLWRGAETTLRKLALDLARERVLRVVEWTLAQNEWVFALAEQAFGDPHATAGNEWPAIDLGDAAAPIRLRGTIDRVDVDRSDSHPKRVRVIDYKGSAETVRQARRELGQTMLQVPLYAVAAASSLDATSSEGMYLPVAELDPRFGEDATFAKRWQEVMRDDARALRDRVRGIVAQVRSGALAPTPERETFCDQCSFDGICRRPRFVAAEFEESDEGGGV
jgi:RecB family exonuclease